MTDRIESTLKKLASVSQSLNQASDEVTSCIADVETALREYKLGIEVWVDIGHWTEGVRSSHGSYYKLARTRRLGYGKKDGKWGLLTYLNAEESEDWEEYAFLRESSREIRLAAIDKLPELLEALVAKAVRTAQQVTKKAEKAGQIAAGLNKKQAP
jgi:prefoldin subunit 5